MKKESYGILDLLIRYFILIILGLPFIDLFYRIFSPLTIYPVYFLLSIFYKTVLFGNILIVHGLPIEIISACIAPSAYYLFFILNLSMPKITINKRIKMLLIAILAFLFINILRIFFLSLLYSSGSSWFDLTHKVFWYLISLVFVVGIWFWEVKKFKIKEIPFFSDLKFLYKNSYLKKFN
jgi:exosortase/archaeosortase family protein